MTYDYAKAQSDRYLEGVEELAKDLERLAATVRAEGRIADPKYAGIHTHAKAAQDVVHTLAWGFANLHTSTLISLALNADAARIATAVGALDDGGVLDEVDRVLHSSFGDDLTVGEARRMLRGEAV